MFPFPSALLMAAAASGGGSSGTAPQFVGGTSAAITSTSDTTISLSSLSGGLASAPAEGDLVIVCYNRAGQGGQNYPPSITTGGYTETVGPIYNGAAGAVNLGVFTKFMGSTPDTSVVVGPIGGSLKNGSVSIHVWRGVDTTTPFDVTSTSATGSGNAFADPPAITPVTGGAMILAIGAASNNDSSLTALTQAGSELSNFVSAVGDGALASGAVALGSVAWSGSGAFDPTAFTGGASSGADWVGVTMALRPIATPTWATDGRITTTGDSRVTTAGDTRVSNVRI